MKNEKTSKPVAKIAAAYLAATKPKNDLIAHLPGKRGSGKPTAIYWSDILTIAASCLTQATDKNGKRWRRVRTCGKRWRPVRTYDDVGFDPRDGSDGKPRKQNVPKPKKNSP